MKRSKIFFLAFIAFAVVVSYLLYSKYFSHIRSQDIVLSEDQEEYKKKPADRGGVVIANSSSLIYEKLNPGGTNNVEAEMKLQPETEEPITLSFKKNLVTTEGYDSIDDILANLALPQEDAKESIIEESEASLNSIDNIMPNTLDATTPTHSNNPTDQEEQTTSHNLKIVQLEDQNNKLYKLNNLHSTDSGYKLHLSSAWSEKEARNEWQRIKSRYSKYLDKTEVNIKKVKANNGKIIYLIMAGNYSSLNQAKLVCKKLNAGKQNCIVTK